jgi:pyrimidine operon attenuation protein/uracil phosphoribosyltransferase
MQASTSQILLDGAGVARTLAKLTAEIAAALPQGVPLAIIGIRSRGEILAMRLVESLKNQAVGPIEVGTLDITLYRDDLAERGPQAILRGTEISFDLAGRYIVLVDDVLYTGRSIRAALDALVDLGRPKAIRLAILVDRPGRELPIQADFVGVRVPREDARVDVKLVESDGIDEVRVT